MSLYKASFCLSDIKKVKIFFCNTLFRSVQLRDLNQKYFYKCYVPLYVRMCVCVLSVQNNSILSQGRHKTVSLVFTQNEKDKEEMSTLSADSFVLCGGCALLGVVHTH